MRTIFINDEFQEIIDQLQAEKKNGNYAEVKKLADVLEKQAIKSNNKYAQVLSYYFHIDKRTFQIVGQGVRCLVIDKFSTESNKQFIGSSFQFCIGLSGRRDRNKRV